MSLHSEVVGRRSVTCAATCVIVWLLAAPAIAIQTTIGGRSVDLDSALSVREVIEENGATKHERTLEQLRVRAAVSLTEWLRFDSTTTAVNGGPTLKADRAGLYSWEDVFQDISPALDFEEAYSHRAPSFHRTSGMSGSSR